MTVHRKILDFIESLVTSSRGRCLQFTACVASRPLPNFEHRLQGCEGLTVQDFTNKDMQSYISSALSKYGERHYELAEDKVEFRHILTQITTTASGVFLWVKLAIASLKQGIMNGDTVLELQTRLA